MTHEQYITLETANLAKQAGFNWEVETFYNALGRACRGESYNWNGETGEYQDVSRPTQSVLQRWLREVKGYNIYITHTYTVKDCQIKSIWEVLYEKMSFLKSNSTLILEDDFGRSLEFDTYEAALEAALQKCLTLIIEKQ